MVQADMTYEDVTQQIDKAKAVIFDNDGTLVDSMPVHYIAWRDALHEHGLDMTEEQFYAMAGMAASQIIPTLADQQNKTDYSTPRILETRQEKLTNGLKKVKRVNVVCDLLDYALSKNLPVAVASGGEQGDVLASLAYAGIDVAEFSAVVTSEDIVNGKPDPETFLTAAERLGIPAEQCIGLEDGDKGLQSLDNAGMAKIDVRRIVDYPLPQCMRT